MAGPHQPSGLPDADLPHQKYMYVCMYVCMYVVQCSSPDFRNIIKVKQLTFCLD